MERESSFEWVVDWHWLNSIISSFSVHNILWSIVLVIPSLKYVKCSSHNFLQTWFDKMKLVIVSWNKVCLKLEEGMNFMPFIFLSSFSVLNFRKPCFSPFTFLKRQFLGIFWWTLLCFSLYLSSLSLCWDSFTVILICLFIVTHPIWTEFLAKRHLKSST